MPKLTPSRTATEMERFAFDLHKDVTEGPGTPAARLKRLHDLLCEFATQNYEAGQAAAAKEILEKVREPEAPAPVGDIPGQMRLIDLPLYQEQGDAQHSGSAPAPAGGVSGGVG